jgi:hypothetical protein
MSSPDEVARLFGRRYVQFGPPDSRGRCPTRSYLAPPEEDGTSITVEGGEAADPFAGSQELRWETTIDASGRLVGRAMAGQEGDSPDMWFVLMDVSRRYGDGMRAVSGFDTTHLSDGTIVTESDFVLMDVTAEQQIGAIVWSARTGEIAEIYVAPQMRRRDVGRRMTNAATWVHQSHGWPGVIRGSGRRTELGQLWAANKIVTRVPAQTELAPPMDPA